MGPSTVIVDQRAWRHIAVSGADRVRFLHGMVTGDINALGPGSWLRTLMLSHKARVLAIFEVRSLSDCLLVSCSPDLYSSVLDTLDRHIVMDDVELEERNLPMYSRWENSEDVWNAEPIWAELADRVSPDEVVECRRIEAGFPRYGVDVNAENFPFESLLGRLVDYDKGCFTGQEPVARVHARGGGGSRRLLGLRGEGGDLLQLGGTVSLATRANAGLVTSVARSEQYGSIALAYLHKSAWEPGSAVRVGAQRAVVAALPFSLQAS